MTPKEAAIKGIKKRVVTKDDAKISYLKWIESNLTSSFSDEVIEFWLEVKKEIKKL